MVSAYAGRIAAGEDIAETLASKINEKANTGISYIAEIYDSELNKKADGKNIRADLYNYFGDLLKKPLTSLTPRMMMNWQKKKEAQGLSPKIKALAALPKKLENYTLRHNFISHLVMNGANLLSVAKLATTSMEMIDRHYGHLQPDLQTNCINQFANQTDSICPTIPKKGTIYL